MGKIKNIWIEIKTLLKKCWNWLRKYIFRKDMIVWLILAELIFWSPVIVCLILAIIVSPWWWTATTSIILFWAGPLTPAVPIQISFAMAFKGLYEKFSRKK